MSQNLVTLNISPDDLAAIAAAITTLQEKLGGLIELSVAPLAGQIPPRLVTSKSPTLKVA